MLIKINPNTYINPECIEAVKKQIHYLGEDDYKGSVDIVIYTNGGGRFYYDGSLEECIEKLKRGVRSLVMKIPGTPRRIDEFNKRNPVINGERHSISEWGKIYNIEVGTINSRIRNGWDSVIAITTPAKRR